MADAVICARCKRESPLPPGEHGTTWIVCGPCKDEMREKAEAQRQANWDRVEFGEQPTEPGRRWNGHRRRV